MNGRLTDRCTRLTLTGIALVKNCQVLEKQKTLTCCVDASLGPGCVVIINLVQSVVMDSFVTFQLDRNAPGREWPTCAGLYQDLSESLQISSFFSYVQSHAWSVPNTAVPWPSI